MAAWWQLAAIILSSVPLGAVAGPGAEKPPALAGPAAFSQLIQQLGDKDFFVRQRAQEALAAKGVDAFDALQEAAANPDLEISSRARYLLRLLRTQIATENDPPEVRKYVRDYEQGDWDVRLAALQSLAEAGPKGIAALCRIVRFEDSLIMAKHAALAVLGRSPRGQPPDPPLAGAIEGQLGSGGRAPTQWLRAFLRFRTDRAAALQEWQKLAAAEEELLRRRPQQSDARIAITLWRMYVHFLEKAGRKPDALAVMPRLVGLEPGDPDSLNELVDWLLSQHAWKMIDELAGRFTKVFARDALLLYAKAAAQMQQGQKAEAEKTALAARGLTDRPGENYLQVRLAIARRLWQRGLFAWAEQECRGVMGKVSSRHLAAVAARSQLAEMFHDQGQDLRAGQVLDEVCEVYRQRTGEEEIGRRRVKEIRSRRHYFYACHWQQQKNAARHREELDKALAADPADVDVLIACYRLPNPTAEYQQKLLKLIRQAASDFRMKAGEEPDEPNWLNQYAWLVGNTEGDFDQALKFSHRSLELSPEEGSYYDTLAHVYYAKGDLANAVKYQEKAAEIDSHSGLIAGQLAVFKAEAAKKLH